MARSEVEVVAQGLSLSSMGWGTKLKSPRRMGWEVWMAGRRVDDRKDERSEGPVLGQWELASKKV